MIGAIFGSTGTDWRCTAATTMIEKPAHSLGELVAGLPVSPLLILVAIIFMYIVLGCFLDIFAAIILTIPIYIKVIDETPIA